MPSPHNTMTPAALQALLGNVVHVLGDMEDVRQGGRVAIQNGREHYGTSAIPMFSSLDELKASVTRDRTYLSMTVRHLFALLPQASFVLNPKSTHRQEFSAEMVKAILDGSYFRSAPPSGAKPETPVPPSVSAAAFRPSEATKAPEVPLKNLGTKMRSVFGLRKK